MQIIPVHHGEQSRIAHTQFAGNVEISVTSKGLCHWSSIKLKFVSLTWPNIPAAVHTAATAHSSKDSTECQEKCPCCL
jgi:hypothetical protein